MASVRFILRGKTQTAAIYCVLSLGRGHVYFRKTGLLIDSNSWSKTKGAPINRDETTKHINGQLLGLKSYLITALNEGAEVSAEWLDDAIQAFFNRKPQRDGLHLAATYAVHYADNLEYKVNGRGELNTAASTSTKYKTVALKLAAFDKYKRRKHAFTDFTLNLRAELIRYFQNVEGLSPNYTGRLIKFVKTIARDAANNGIEVAPQLAAWQGFTVKAEKIILNPDELGRIAATKFTNPRLEAARDWLLIGCYTGQRVSDLLRMNASMIETHTDPQNPEFVFQLIVITQQKTKKTVHIPIHEVVSKILEKRGGQFPESFGSDKGAAVQFNRYLKQVAKAAGIDEITFGRLKDESRKAHTAEGHFPKWQLVTSHICRRSFASNFYGLQKYPTPMLMAITAHSSERQFLEYIGKKPFAQSLELARIWATETAERSAKAEAIVRTLER